MKVTNITKNYHQLFLIVTLLSLGQRIGAFERSEVDIINSTLQNEQSQRKIDLLLKNYPIRLDSKDHQSVPLMQKGAMSQYKVLHHLLISSLDKITLHLTYWKTVQFSTIKYFVTNPIKALLGKKDVQNHIDGLESEQIILATHLGNLKRAFDKDLSNQDNMFFLISLMHQILTEQKSFEKSEANVAQDQALKELNANFDLLPKYEEREKRTVQEHAKPSHIMRNWIGYTLGSIGLLCASDYIYQNSDSIPLWKAQTIKAVSRFWQTHISDPLKNSWSILFSKQQHNGSLLTNLQCSVQQEIKTYFSGNKNITMEQINRAVEAAQNGTLAPIIQDDWNTKAHTSFATKLVSPSHSQITNIFAHTIGIHLLNKLENIENKHRLNIELTAIIPAVGLFGVSAYILHKIYSICAPQKNIQKPIRFTLRNIENILNKSRHQEQLTPQEEGFIIYYIHHLKSYLDWIPHKERPLFLEDICQLEFSEFSITQKIAVVERISRTYPFLNEIIK